jgi:uncharacterized protein YbjT (DUF2867 family)
MILITGATGTTGRALIAALSERGTPVRALVHTAEKAAGIAGPGIEIAIGDLAQPDTLDRALVGVERAYLLTPSSPGQVELEGNFIAAAVRAGGPHIVKHSVVGADPRASGRLVRWQGQAEQALAASGLPATVLRPNFFMQGTFAFAPTIAAHGAFYLPQKDGCISYVDVGDIAAVAAVVLTGTGYVGKTYDITGPASLSNDEVAATLTQALGKAVAYVDISPDDTAAALRGAGLPDWYADGLVELYVAASTGQYAEVTTVVADIARRQPTSFARFAHAHAAAYGHAPVGAGR